MAMLDHTVRQVRAASALTPARPAWALGVRAAIATVAPLLAAQLAGHPQAGTWISIAALHGVLGDPGGSYRSRARFLAAVAGAGAVAAGLGTLVAGRGWPAVLLAFAMAAAGGLARAWGNVGIGVGLSLALTFVIALAVPAADLSEAPLRAGLVLLGGVWAMLLVLVLWPVRPEGPAREAVAACYRALAEYAEELARTVRAGDAPDPWELRERTAAVRRALEAARGVLATTRSARPGASRLGSRLFVLHEAADHAVIHLVALADALGSMPSGLRRGAAGRETVQALGRTTATLRTVAVLVEEARPPAAAPAVVRVDPAGSPADPHHAYAARLLSRLDEYADAAMSTARALDGGQATAGHGAHSPSAAVSSALAAAPDIVDDREESPLDRLRAVLAPDSLILRFAVRVGLVVAAAVWLAEALELSHGHWVTITALVVLQPYTGLTTLRALQRGLGTILGAVLTAGLGALFHGPATILLLCFVFTGTAVAVMPISYAAFSVFVTPAFVLLAEVSTGDWELAGVRVLNTLLGGALALLAARLVWPAPEWHRVPEHLAAAMRARRAYLRAVLALVTGEMKALSGLREARADLARTSANAEESFQRLLGEHRGPVAELEPLMALLAESRRVNASLGALALSGVAGESDRSTVADFGRAAEALLAELADALREGRTPAPLPPELDTPPAAAAGEGSASLLHARLRRLAHQLGELHRAQLFATASRTP